MISALILAAGKSERMGFPKALIEYEGLTFLERILKSVDASSIGDCLVVTGRHDSEITRRFPGLPVVFNPDFELGMTTSFQAGIRMLPASADAAMIFLVDHPLVSVETILALAAERDRADVVVPVHQGRRGHPVLFSRAMLDEILVLAPTLGVNTLVRSEPERVHEIRVEDPGILTDIDTLADLEALRERRPIRGS